MYILGILTYHEHQAGPDPQKRTFLDNWSRIFYRLDAIITQSTVSNHFRKTSLNSTAKLTAILQYCIAGDRLTQGNSRSMRLSATADYCNSAVWHNRHLAPASPVSAKCGGEAGNWNMTQRPHHAGVEVTPQAANLSPYQVQSRHHCPQMSKWSCCKSTCPTTYSTLVSVGLACVLPVRPY